MDKVQYLFFKGSWLVGSAIRWQTWGDWGHVALQFPSGVSYESVGLKGVIEHLGGHPRINEATVLELHCTTSEVEAMEKWCKEQVGKGYDYRAILRFVTRSRYWSNDRWFCSELGFCASREASIELFSRVKPWKVHPSLLFTSPKLTSSQKV